MIPFFFFSTAILVSGIGESIPSTDDKTFQIFVEPAIVEDLVFIPDAGLSFTVNPEGEEGETLLLVKIPKNFPTLTTRSNTSIYDPMIPIGDDDFELQSDMTEDKCFFNYVISVQNPTDVQLLYTYPPVNDPYIISKTIDRDCFEQVFAEPECGAGYELQYNKRSEQVCVFSSSVEKLLIRGYLM